jgi:hypothetical protein
LSLPKSPTTPDSGASDGALELALALELELPLELALALTDSDPLDPISLTAAPSSSPQAATRKLKAKRAPIALTKLNFFIVVSLSSKTLHKPSNEQPIVGILNIICFNFPIFALAIPFQRNNLPLSKLL